MQLDIVVVLVVLFRSSFQSCAGFDIPCVIFTCWILRLGKSLQISHRVLLIVVVFCCCRCTCCEWFVVLPQVALWKVWVPATIFNFTFSPMYLRIPVVAMTSLIWTCILSAMRGSDAPPISADQAAEVIGNQVSPQKGRKDYGL
jgi:hypothetical protein